MIPTLHTDRLTLRAPRADDFETYAAFRASERAKMLGGPFTRAQAFDQFCNLVGHWTLRGYGRWLVADRETDEPLGIVGLLCPETWPEPELAWSVFAPAEGRGIAYEAAVAARAYAYEHCGLGPLISLVATENTRSAALAKRLGATPDGSVDLPGFGATPVWRHPGPKVGA